MANVYVIGQKQQVTGFIGVGVKAVEVSGAEPALEHLRRLAAEPDTALVLIYESLLENALAAVEEIREQTHACLLVIPDHLGSRGLMLNAIRESIEKSIGVDLLGKEAGSTRR